MTRQASRSAFFAILLTGAAAAAAGQTEELPRTLRMEPGARLEIDNVRGETAVTGVDGDELTIRAAKRLVGPGSAEALDHVEVRIEERGGRVVVKPRYRRSILQSLGLVGGRPRVAVDFTVTVPRRAGVTIESVAGDVAVEGVDGETRVDVVSGDVRLASLSRLVHVETVSGDLHLRGVGSDDSLSAETISGRLRAETVRAPRIEVESVSGAVALRAVESRRVEVETVSGSVTFDGAFADDGRYEFESFSGDVHLSVAEGSGFEIEAESFSGELRSGFPIRVGAGERAGEVTAFERGSRSLRGVAAGGGARVRVSTFSGDMSIGADALEIDPGSER